jgi:hypothetical protein
MGEHPFWPSRGLPISSGDTLWGSVAEAFEFTICLQAGRSDGVLYRNHIRPQGVSAVRCKRLIFIDCCQKRGDCRLVQLPREAQEALRVAE